jgi:hypothetical protein
MRPLRGASVASACAAGIESAAGGIATPPLGGGIAALRGRVDRL